MSNPCPDCNGTGTQPDFQFQRNISYADSGCRNCRGTGRLPKIDWNAEGKEASDAIRRSEIIPDRSLIVGSPRPVENSELRTLMAEMAKQASLGHKRFCVGIHDYGHLGVEEEWIDWPEAFQRLAAKGKKCAVCGKPAVTADVDGEPLCRKCFDACPDEDEGEDSDAE